MSAITIFPARVAGVYKSRFAQVIAGLLLGVALGVFTPRFCDRTEVFQ